MPETASDAIARLREMDQQATPPPWEWADDALHLVGAPIYDELIVWPRNATGEPTTTADAIGACGERAEADAEANMALVAAARNALPTLLAVADVSVDALVILAALDWTVQWELAPEVKTKIHDATTRLTTALTDLVATRQKESERDAHP